MSADKELRDLLHKEMPVSADEIERRVLELKAKLDASPTPPATEGRERLGEVHAFLMGEGPLDGRWFGDDPPVINGRKHPFWWRVALRAALLSSPRVEEVRREALEEAAKIVEAMSPTYVSNGRRFLKENGAALDELAPHLEAQRIAKLQLQGKPDINEFERAAASIRSLSLPDGEGKEKLARSPSALSAPTTTGNEGHDQ